MNEENACHFTEGRPNFKITDERIVRDWKKNIFNPNVIVLFF